MHSVGLSDAGELLFRGNSGTIYRKLLLGSTVTSSIAVGNQALGDTVVVTA